MQDRTIGSFTAQQTSGNLAGCNVVWEMCLPEGAADPRHWAYIICHSRWYYFSRRQQSRLALFSHARFATVSWIDAVLQMVLQMVGKSSRSRFNCNRGVERVHHATVLKQTRRALGACSMKMSRMNGQPQIQALDFCPVRYNLLQLRRARRPREGSKARCTSSPWPDVQDAWLEKLAVYDQSEMVYWLSTKGDSTVLQLQ